jgi:hypothetical protein
VVRRLGWDEVWGRRLARHFLLEPAPADRLVEVAGTVCGIHAQMMASAELSIGLRLAGVTRTDLRVELWERRRLVKTHGLRGTVHLFPAAELSLWLAALRAAPPPRRASPPGPGPRRVDTLVEAICAALDGTRLTRDELGAEVARRAGPWALEPGLPAFGGTAPVWTQGIGPAAHAGVLCFGPNRGAKVTYARVDQWVGPAEPVDGEQALAEVLRRFLAMYGPATHREFARWFNTDERAAAGLIRGLGDEVEPVDVDGWRAWQPAGTEPAPPAAGTALLLPHFDCYVVGAHPRGRLIHPQWTQRGLTRGTAATLPVLLVGGVVAGIWQRRSRGRSLAVTVDAFDPLTAGQREQVDAQVGRIGEILHSPATVHFGPIEARPHL